MLDKTISEISSMNAGAAGVFRRLNIDHCEDGARRLKDVLGERALDAAAASHNMVAIALALA